MPLTGYGKSRLVTPWKFIIMPSPRPISAFLRVLGASAFIRLIAYARRLAR